MMPLNEGTIMRDLDRRIARLETGRAGGGRLIVISWPGNDHDAAMRAKGLEARQDDLVIMLTRSDFNWDKPGWVSVDRRLLA
jgi:hypothetical protein